MKTFSKTWLNRAIRVVDFVSVNPGSTAQEIAYYVGLSLSTVHDIIDQYGPANAQAVAGMVPAIDRHLKPRWYRPGMALVKNYTIDVAGNFVGEFDGMTEPVRNQMVEIIRMSAPNMVRPSMSMRKRRRAVEAVVSQVKLAGVHYQVIMNAATSMAPRLAAVEKQLALLTAPEALAARYGHSELRKTV